MTNEELIKLGYEMLGETEGEIKIPPMKPMREFIKTSIEALKTQRPKGKWILEEVKDEDGRPYDIKYYCSECQAERPPIWADYCSACGAEMEIKE